MYSFVKSTSFITIFFKNTFAIVLIFIAFQLSAQDISFTQGSNNLNHFYADLIGKTATLNGGWGLFGGMRAGYNINNNIN